MSSIVDVARWRSVAAVLAATVALPSCGASGRALAPGGARLRARPKPPTGECAPGMHTLEVGSARAAVLYVPRQPRPGYPLLVVLHGAGGQPGRIVERLVPAADAWGVTLVGPPSHDRTWDGVRGRPGPDAATIDRALEATFDRCAVAKPIAIGGFSDGASYALSLGLANGDLFSHVVAFSPCVLTPGLTRIGRPRVFLSHGRADEILPFDRCGDALASWLEGQEYPVRFEPFAGGHEVPAAIADEALRWLVGGRR